MLQYDGAQIQDYIRNMCANQHHAEHAKLQVLFAGFFLPFLYASPFRNSLSVTLISHVQ